MTISTNYLNLLEALFLEKHKGYSSTSDALPKKVMTSVPVAVFQRNIVLSSDPDANKPFWLKATELTAPVWPVNVLNSAPESVLQSLIVVSPDPDANKPLPLNATE